MKIRSRRHVVLAAVAASCLVAASCSEDREPSAAPAQPAPTAPPATVAPPAAAPETAPPETAPPETAPPETDSPAETASAPETTGPTFGDMPWPCGPAETPNTDDGNTPGVTADSILIGIGDDAGFSVVPGLNKEATDATNAMVAACNELGGINGRQITANYYDSKLTEVSSAVLRACGDQVFWLVGQAWAFDEQMEEIRQNCKLPSSPTYTISGVSSHAPLMHQGLPNPVDEQTGAALAFLNQEFPDETQAAGILSINIGAALTARDKILAIAEGFGWNFLTTDITSNPMGEADWTPFVNQLEGAGVQVVYFSGQCFPMVGEFARAAEVNRYEPILLGPPNMYEPRCAEDANGVLDNFYFNLDLVPMFEAEHNKATQDYVDAVEADGGDVSSIGMSAASSFLLWASAADACGATLTRECVLEQMANVHEWTAGGLHATSDPGNNHPPTCSALFKFSGDGFERVYPEEPATYECNPDFLAPVDVPQMLDPLLLDEQRVSHVYTD